MNNSEKLLLGYKMSLKLLCVVKTESFAIFIRKEYEALRIKFKETYQEMCYFYS